jgi:purine-nucleoside phosphorylase
MAREAADHIRRRAGMVPAWGLLTGTGIGEVTREMAAAAAIDYAEIPHFPRPTAPGHAGRLLLGAIRGRPAAVLQGRFHLYEGYRPAEVAFPVRVLQELGVRRLVVTNAAGGIRPGLAVGDLMLIADHINLTGENPLVGPNAEAWGPRFPDMGRAYDPGLAARAARAAAKLGIALSRGVYAGLKGPSLETPAEIRFLRAIGADAVGLSTVTEVIAAVHAGMAVLGVSIVSNLADPDRPQPARIEAIIEAARGATPDLARLIGAFLEEPDDA